MLVFPNFGSLQSRILGPLKIGENLAIIKKISKFLKLGVGIVTCWQISHSNKQKIALVWLGPKEKKKGTNYILMERLQLDFHHIIEKHV